MPEPTFAANRERMRNVAYLYHPRLWPHWPFLPLTRRRPDVDDELGLLFDAVTYANVYGHSSSVFLTNLFLMPPTLAEFLTLPREVFDTREEIYAAGWRID